MARRTAAVLSRAVRAAKPELAELSDRDLLRRYADDGDQSAFAAVVARHKAMVLGVCRRVLQSPADAEDATQAVFLVLAKKAKGTRWQASAANWLYTAARKVARNARLATERRSKRERSAAVPEAANPADAMSGRELIAALDDELDKLTTRYREPLVLCYLEGLTRDEAAARLNLAVPALNKQLERGRKKLADALAARGCALGVLLLTVAATSTATAAPNTIASILTAVAGKPSATAVALAQGLTMNSTLSRAKLTALALLGVALGFGAVAAMPAPADPPKSDKVVKKADTKADAKTADAKPMTVSGTVIGPDGKPVAGAVLRLPDTLDLKKALLTNAPMKMGVVEVGKTDADGKFTVSVPPMPSGTPDYRQLVATKAGFGPAWIDVREVTDAPVTLQLVPDDVPVKGRVTDLEGKPVAKAKVELKYISSGDLSRVWGVWARRPESALQPLKNMWAELSGLPATLTTDADGKFEITGVGRGRLLAFMVEGPGIETAGCRVVTDPKFDPKTVEQPSQDTMPGGAYTPGPALYGAAFTHTAKPAQPIVGVVTDSKTGKPIAGVQVNGHPDGPHWYESGSRAFTDADGKFTMHGVAKTDRVRLMVFPTAKQPYFQYSTTVAGKPGLTEIPVELKLTKGVMVKGRVTEKGSGAPVAGAGIRYAALGDNKFYAALMNGKRGESGMAWNSDADGRFEMIVMPGSGIVTAQGETRGRQRGTDYTQVRIAKDDLPKAYGRDQESLGESFTAADGHFITMFSLSGYKIIDPKPADDTVEVEIVFDRGKTVTGKVVDADGKPAAGVMAYKMTACYDYPQKLKDGTFTAIALEADHPRTVLFVNEAKKLAASIDLKGDEKDVTVKLEPWGKLSGRLLDADGRPIAGASVSAYPKSAMKHMAFATVMRERPATTDKDGTFALDLPAGPAEYLPGFSLKNKYLDIGFRPDMKGHTVKPGETTDLGVVKVKGD